MVLTQPRKNLSMNFFELNIYMFPSSESAFQSSALEMLTVSHLNKKSDSRNFVDSLFHLKYEALRDY